MHADLCFSFPCILLADRAGISHPYTIPKCNRICWRHRAWLLSQSTWHPCPVSRALIRDTFGFILAEPAASLMMTEVPQREEALTGRMRGAAMAASGDTAVPCCETFML